MYYNAYNFIDYFAYNFASQKLKFCQLKAKNLSAKNYNNFAKQNIKIRKLKQK